MFIGMQPVFFPRATSLFVHACTTLHNITIDIDGGGQASEADFAFDLPEDAVGDLGAEPDESFSEPSEARSKDLGRVLRRNIAASLPAVGRPARKSDQHLS